MKDDTVSVRLQLPRELHSRLKAKAALAGVAFQKWLLSCLSSADKTGRAATKPTK